MSTTAKTLNKRRNNTMTQTKPTPEVISALAAEIHQNAKDKGFWDGEPDIETFLMLIVCELSEAVEADRKEKRADRSAYDNWTGAWGWQSQFRIDAFKGRIKDTVQDELADAAIRILDLAEHFGMVDNVSCCQNSSALFMVNSSFAGKVYRIARYMPSGRVVAPGKLHESFSAHLKVVIGSIFDLAESLEIDLLWHMREKMAYNATRERLHGKKY